MSNLINVRTATMSQLVAFFNENTGGNPVKKFADRPTAEKRVQKLLDEMAAEAYAKFADGENGRLEGTDTPEVEDENNGVDLITYMQREAGVDRAPTNEENGEGPFLTAEDLLAGANGTSAADLPVGKFDYMTGSGAKLMEVAKAMEARKYANDTHEEVEALAALKARVGMSTVDKLLDHTAREDDGSVHAFSVHGQTHCKHCGVHLSNGVGEHNQEVNGKLVKHNKYEFECLACGNEFGPDIPAKKVTTPTGKARPAMQATLKLDRRIRNVKTGETWKNAYQLWMANPSWMTSSQVDRLTAQLYSAAKKGYQVTVTINGRDFSLVSVATA